MSSKTIYNIFLALILVMTLLIVVLVNLKAKDQVQYTLAEVESTISNEVSGVYSTEDSLIELAGKDIRIIDILNKRVFTIVLEEPLNKKEVYETKVSKLKRSLKGVYGIKEDSSYQYFVENLAIAILPSAEVTILKFSKLKGIEKIDAVLTSTTVIPNLDQAIRNYNDATMRFPDMRKYLTTSYDVIVVDELNMQFHVFSSTGITSIGMQGQFPSELPQYTITEMLTASKDLDLGTLLRSKHDNFVFQYTCNIGNYVLSLDTMGQQYLYNTLTDSYEFITTVN